MSKTISAKKGLSNVINVAASYLVAVGALWLAKKTGVDVSVEIQSEVIAVTTALLAGSVTAVMNYIKHKGDKKA